MSVSAMSISAVQSHTPDVNADEMSNSRRSPSLISISVGDDHPCCRRSHGFLRSFSLTGTIFLSIRSHFARIQSSRSQYFTNTNHLSCGTSLLLLEACFKSLRVLIRAPLIGSTAVTSHAAVNSDARSNQISFKIFEYAASKHASSCSATRPNYQSQPPLMGFTYIGAWSQHTNYTHQMKI